MSHAIQSILNFHVVFETPYVAGNDVKNKQATEKIRQEYAEMCNVYYEFEMKLMWN